MAGGHGIADEDVERRYVESFVNMKKSLQICGRVYFYDNTDTFTLVAISENRVIDIRGNELQLPEWIKKILYIE